MNVARHRRNETGRLPDRRSLKGFREPISRSLACSTRRAAHAFYVSLSRGFGDAMTREVGPSACEGSGSAKFTAAFVVGAGGEPRKPETVPGLRAGRAVALVSPDGGN